MSLLSNHKKFSAVFAYLFAAALGALGQFCFKLYAAEFADLTRFEMVFHPFLWIAMFSYFGVMGLFITGLKLFGQLSVLYPVYGSTFIWSVVISGTWLNEPISGFSLAGVGLIVLGIVLLFAQTPPNSKESQ